MRVIVRSKIHRARVTEAAPGRGGSISIDEALMDRAGLWPYERVLVVSLSSGVRFETYVIPARRESGTIALNGMAAHRFQTGEQISVMGFEPAAEPTCGEAILVDDDNRFLRFV
jgi:aspartate 1-decarboxylase